MGTDRRWRRLAASAVLLMGLGLAAPAPSKALLLDDYHCDLVLSVELGPGTGSPRSFSGHDRNGEGTCVHAGYLFAHAGGGFTSTISGTVSWAECGIGRLDGHVVVVETLSGRRTSFDFSVDTRLGAGATHVYADASWYKYGGGGDMALVENVTTVDCVPAGTGGNPEIDVPGVLHLDENGGWGPPGSYIFYLDFTLLF